MITHLNKKRGFTIFFAMLVGSLALAVGIAIYDLTVREIDLSAAASQSQYAIYAADTGVECALYWDAKVAPPLNGSPSAFGTSSAATWGASPINCNGQNITTQGPPAIDLARYDPGCTASAWCKVPQDASSATTTFSITIPNSGTPVQTYCAVVQVGKSTAGGVLYTNIVSRGYNNCAASGAARLERTLRVNY